MLGRLLLGPTTSRLPLRATTAGVLRRQPMCCCFRDIPTMTDKAAVSVTASAHGAGLMLVPVLLGLPIGSETPDLPELAASTTMLIQDLAALLIHSLATLLVMGTVAVVVYERLGVGVLRRAG